MLIIDYSFPNLEIVTDRLFYYRDSSGTLDVGEMMSQHHDRFKPLSTKVFNAPPSNHVHWFRFEVENNTDESQYLRIGDSFSIGHLEVYGPFSTTSLAGTIPDSGRTIISKSSYFLTIPPSKGDDLDTYYIRLKGLFPQLLVFHLGSFENQLEQERLRDQSISIFKGVMICVILYNLFLLFSIKERVFFYYVSYLTLILLAVPFTYGKPIIKDDWFEVYYFTFQVPLVIFITLFAIRYLHISRISIRSTQWLWLTVCIICLAGLINLIFPEQLPQIVKLLQPVLLLHNLNLLFVGIYVWIKGYKKARFYVLAWIFFWFGTTVFILTINGILPFNALTSNALIFGVGMEALLFAMALGDRLNILKADHEKIQREKLEIVRDKNVDLEWKVVQKTRELQVSNDLTSDLNQKLIGSNKKLIEQREELKLALNRVKNVQNQLIQSEKMAAIGVLAAGIGHEINNPLNYIQGGLLAIQNEMLNPSVNRNKVNQYLNSIKEGINRCVQITKGLASYSRQQVHSSESCDMVSVIESCLNILRNELKDIKVIRNFDFDSAEVRGNEGRLHQAFLNILANATQAVGEYGVITVSISKTNDAAVNVQIEDNGSGIESKHLSKISDPFFTTKSVGQGTGLGLWITYAIIKEHNGNIDCFSQVGIGTKFLVDIPAMKPSFTEP